MTYLENVPCEKKCYNLSHIMEDLNFCYETLSNFVVIFRNTNKCLVIKKTTKERKKETALEELNFQHSCVRSSVGLIPVV